MTCRDCSRKGNFSQASLGCCTFFQFSFCSPRSRFVLQTEISEKYNSQFDFRFLSLHFFSLTLLAVRIGTFKNFLFGYGDLTEPGLLRASSHEPDFRDLALPLNPS